MDSPHKGPLTQSLVCSSVFSVVKLNIGNNQVAFDFRGHATYVISLLCHSDQTIHPMSLLVNIGTSKSHLMRQENSIIWSLGQEHRPGTWFTWWRPQWKRYSSCINFDFWLVRVLIRNTTVIFVLSACNLNLLTTQKTKMSNITHSGLVMWASHADTDLGQ